MRLASGDTILFAWEEDHDRVCSVHFSKVAPNDSIIIKDMEILPREDWRQTGYYDYEPDSEDGIVIIVWGEGRAYIRKYDNEMNELFQTCVGRTNGHVDIIVDHNNYIHVGGGFRPPEGTTYLGYSQLDDEGNLLDSAEAVYGREEHPRVNWRNTKVFRCEDGFTGVIWLDDRFGARHRELFMIYKTQNDVRNDNYFLPSSSNLKIFPNYPDPFNNSTIIPFIIPPSGAEFLIVNSLGRTVFKQIIPAGKGGFKTYNWRGIDSNSLTLPSGRYWVLLRNRNGKAVESVSIVR